MNGVGAEDGEHDQRGRRGDVLDVGLVVWRTGGRLHAVERGAEQDVGELVVGRREPEPEGQKRQKGGQLGDFLLWPLWRV